MQEEGLGAENIAVVIENPKNGEILAMANYPNFDLNDPKNMKDYYTQEQLNAMSDDDTLNTLEQAVAETSVLHIHMSRVRYRSLLPWHVDWIQARSLLI